MIHKLPFAGLVFPLSCKFFVTGQFFLLQDDLMYLYINITFLDIHVTIFLFTEIEIFF